MCIQTLLFKKDDKSLSKSQVFTQKDQLKAIIAELS